MLLPDLAVARPNLVWAFDFAGGEARPLKAEDLDAEGRGEAPRPQDDAGPLPALRWLHVNLADQSSCRWIAGFERLPAEARELLLSPDTHPRALVAGTAVACVVHDFEVDFATEATSRVGALRFALAPGLMLTGRHHPLYAADVVRRRIDAGARPANEAAALDLLLASIAGIAARTTAELDGTVQAAEDALLLDGFEPDSRAIVAARRRAAQLHRQLGGIRAILARLEEDEDLPEALLSTVERLAQRVSSLDADVRGVQADVKLLRDELDLQATRRTNANLYVLSILSALLLPATLVTGFFGMNTGGLPLATGSLGTLVAGAVAIGSAFAVYLWLRARGFLGG